MQTVTKGQQIGMMGETGDSQGIHLHFEIAYANSGWNTEAGTMNPEIYLQMTFGGGGVEPPKRGTDLYTLYLSDVLRWR